MRAEAKAVRLVSGERIGGGLAADGMGELSKLLLGREPARALRLARDTGVLVELLPEFEKAIGFDQESRYHSLTVDEHTFEVVQAAADQNYSLAVRLAALFHDLGKPHVAWRGSDGRLHYYAKPGFSDKSHEQVGCELAQSALSRLRYPNALRSRVLRIIRHHMFQIGKGDALRARRFLAKHGDEVAFELVDHKEADYRGKPGENGGPPLEDIEKLERFRGAAETGARPPAPARRSRGRRQRSDRARVQAGAGARPHPARPAPRGRRRSGARTPAPRCSGARVRSCAREPGRSLWTGLRPGRTASRSRPASAA